MQMRALRLNYTGDAAMQISKQRQDKTKTGDFILGILNSRRKWKWTSAIFVADGGESPDVSQVDGESDDGQQEFRFLGPRFALRVAAINSFRMDDIHVDSCSAWRQEDDRLRFLIIYCSIN